MNFGTGKPEQGLDSAGEALRPGAAAVCDGVLAGLVRSVGASARDAAGRAAAEGHGDDVLSAGRSINIYMFHGGTSFGDDGRERAQRTGNYRGNVTSYDYDAPLDEAGHPTPKFFAYRDVILKYTQEASCRVPEVAEVIAVPEFTVTPAASLVGAAAAAGQERNSR